MKKIKKCEVCGIPNSYYNLVTDRRINEKNYKLCNNCWNRVVMIANRFDDLYLSGEVDNVYNLIEKLKNNGGKNGGKNKI